MLGAIVLIVVSIFFPPAWIALIAYIGYLLITKKSRRNRKIIKEINKSLAEGKESRIVESLYYEAAKSFASDHGASMSPYKNDPSDDCLFVDLVLDGIEYNVCFQRWELGGTLINVSLR